LVCPVTSRVKGFPFEVLVPDGLPVAGAILSDQVRSLDWRERQASFMCQLPDVVLAQVLGRIEALLFQA